MKQDDQEMSKSVSIQKYANILIGSSDEELIAMYEQYATGCSTLLDSMQTVSGLRKGNNFGGAKMKQVC